MPAKAAALAAKKAPAAKPAAKAAAKPAAKAAPAKQAAKPAAPAKAAAKPAAKVTASGNGVYVKGLGNADVAAVKALFESAGATTQIRLRRNKFALVFFANAASVKKAVDSFNGKFALGAELTVSAAKTSPKADKAEGSKTIIAAPMFRAHQTKKTMRAIFADCGKIVKFNTYKQNFVRVAFADAAAAAKAVSKVNGSTVGGHKLRVALSARK